jgi:hypothetical protein
MLGTGFSSQKTQQSLSVQKRVQEADVGDVVDVERAGEAAPPVKRARYSLMVKDDITSPGAVPAAAPGAPPNEANQAYRACGG